MSLAITSYHSNHATPAIKTMSQPKAHHYANEVYRLMDTQNYDIASEYAKKALELDPSNRLALSANIDLAFRLGNIKKGASLLKTFLSGSSAQNKEEGIRFFHEFTGFKLQLGNPIRRIKRLVTSWPAQAAFGLLMQATTVSANDSSDNSCAKTFRFSHDDREDDYRFYDNDNCDFVTRVTSCFSRRAPELIWRVLDSLESFGDSFESIGGNIYYEGLTYSGRIYRLDEEYAAAEEPILQCAREAHDARAASRAKRWEIIGYVVLALCICYCLCACGYVAVRAFQNLDCGGSSNFISSSTMNVAPSRRRRYSSRQGMGGMSFNSIAMRNLANNKV